MADDFKYDVFLSHSSKDKDVARDIAERLRGDGLRVWFDAWEIRPGDSILSKIEEGLEHSRVLVLCMSANAFGSDWTQLEAGTFRFRDPLNRGRRFVPLRLDTAKIKGSLAQFLYINWLQENREQEYEKLLAACRGESDLRSRIPLENPLLKSKTEEARRAARMHDDESAIRLWEEVRRLAEEAEDSAKEIGARLDACFLRLRSGSELGDVLAVLDSCIRDAKTVELGEDRARLLQLLGEAHRIKGNPDLARGFITSALEQSRLSGHKGDEGWALLALSALEKEREFPADSQSKALDLIRQACDCFSALYASGDAEKQRAAQEGFAACHSWRAEILGHAQLDDAMVEYARELELLRGMGSEYEWDVADALFRRGSLHARADDPQLAAKDLIGATNLFEKIGDHIKEAECVLTLAELLDRRGLRLESRPYYERAAVTTMRQKNRRRSAWIWFRFAHKLIELREFDEGKSILLTLLQGDGFTQGQRLDVLKNLCLVAKAMGDEDELRRHSEAALGIIDEKIAGATSASKRRKLIISKGQTLEELGEHDRAVACLRRAIEGFEASSDHQGMGECWFHIAGVIGKMGKHKEEREAYEKVLAAFGEKGDSFFVPMTLTMLAQLDIREQRFEEARKRLDLAEQRNEKVRNPVVFLIGKDLRSKLPSAASDEPKPRNGEDGDPESRV